VRFTTKVNLPSVGSDGKVNFARNNSLAQWNGAQHGIKDILLNLKIEMQQNRNAAQPPEGEMY